MSTMLAACWASTGFLWNGTGDGQWPVVRLRFGKDR